ncbi:MAG: hypothetical protein RL617_312 [Pseudomonadota bacterium]
MLLLKEGRFKGRTRVQASNAQLASQTHRPKHPAEGNKLRGKGILGRRPLNRRGGQRRCGPESGEPPELVGRTRQPLRRGFRRPWPGLQNL